MSFDLSKLLRPHIAEMKPYSSARDEYTGAEGVFLDANENAYGSTTSEDFSRYPDPHAKAVKAKYGQLIGFNPSQIFLGNGSDEPIDLLVRAFCNPGVDNVVILPPTYGMYKVSAALNNVTIKTALLDSDFQIDVPKTLETIDENTKIVFLCSPNNPTGNSVHYKDIVSILQNTNCIVVVDQAYIDFAPEGNFLPEIKNYPHLVVLRTFSKAWGLAALRLGMAFGSQAIIDILNKIKPPYNINVLTQLKVLEALDGIDKKDKAVAQILANRTELVQQLAKLDIVKKIYPSDANYLLVVFENSDKVFGYLIEKQVIVRDRSKEPGCAGALRISVGTTQENETLMKYLKEFSL